MGPIECCNNTKNPSHAASEAQHRPNKDLKKQNQVVGFFFLMLRMEFGAGCGVAWLTVSPSRPACLCDFAANLVYIVSSRPARATH